MQSTKALFLIVVAALSLGAMTVLPPTRGVLDNRDTAPVIPPVYAPPVEDVSTVQLQTGQTLSMLLMRASITGGDLAELLRALNTQQNLRGLPVGSEVTIKRWAATNEARSVELRVRRDTTIRVAREGMGWTTSIIETPTVLDTVYMTGQIDAGKSLYEAIAYNDSINLPVSERIELVVDLASIYEYKLDFAHEIHPGDRYSFAYEREARPDGTARRRRILIARVETGNKAHDAVFFNQGDIRGYYDLDGKSLKRGFRKSPLDYTRVTSSFAWKRYHPVLGVYRAHLGTDYGASTGTPIKAVGEGTVQFAGRQGGYGNVIILRHINGYTTRYAHMSRFASGIRVGKRVQLSDVIGYVGSSGLATGPHLHYEFRKNGQPVDASKIDLPSAPPLPAQYRTDYRSMVKSRLVLLEEAQHGARYAKRQAQSAPVGGGI
ncbi:MAG: M23 family metallopeptidase [Gemmatimonadota bacterium]